MVCFFVILYSDEGYHDSGTSKGDEGFARSIV